MTQNHKYAKLTRYRMTDVIMNKRYDRIWVALTALAISNELVRGSNVYEFIVAMLFMCSFLTLYIINRRR